MKQKKTKHEFRSNTLPALITVGPVTLLMVLLIAVPLIYVAVMSFCSIDEFYNVTFQFTLQNYVRLANTDYLRIYAQSMGIALITTLICILVGYPFSYIIARTKSRKKKILYMLVIIVPETVYTILITLLFYPCILWMNNRLEKSEQRSSRKFV